MSLEIKETSTQLSPEGLQNIGIGLQGELIKTAQVGESYTQIRKYKPIHSSLPATFISEIKKSKNDQLLVLPGLIGSVQGEESFSIEYFGVREKGVSGFIKSQVTGESFVMNEVKGQGVIRLTPSSDALTLQSFNKQTVCIPNTNIDYFIALIGKYELSAPEKAKKEGKQQFTEILFDDGCVIMEAETLYELKLVKGKPIEVEASELVFWAGDLTKQESPLTSNSVEGEFIRFDGNGSVFLTLSN